MEHFFSLPTTAIQNSSSALGKNYVFQTKPNLNQSELYQLSSHKINTKTGTDDGLCTDLPGGVAGRGRRQQSVQWTLRLCLPSTSYQRDVFSPVIRRPKVTFYTVMKKCWKKPCQHNGKKESKGVDPGIESVSPTLASMFFTTELPEKLSLCLLMGTKGKCLWKKWYHERNDHWLKQIKKKTKVSNPPKNPTVLQRHCIITFMLVKGWNTNLGRRNLCRQRKALGITESNTQIITFASSRHFSIWEAILILFEEYRSLMKVKDHYLLCWFKRFRFW